MTSMYLSLLANIEVNFSQLNNSKYKWHTYTDFGGGLSCDLNVSKFVKG